MSGPSSTRADQNLASGSSQNPTDGDVDVFHKFQQLAHDAWDLTHQALTLDEGRNVDGDPSAAALLYAQAILVLEHGLATFHGIPQSLRIRYADRYEQALLIKEKMRPNLDMVKERAAWLCGELDANMLAGETGIGNPEPTKTTADMLPYASVEKSPAQATRSNPPTNVEGPTLTTGPPPKITPGSATPKRTYNTLPKATGAKPARTPSSGRGDTSSPNTRRPVQSVLAISRLARPASPQTKSRPGSPAPSTPRTQRKPLKNVDPMAQLILDQILDNSPGITWDAVAGQAGAKQALEENVVWPELRPEVFTGLRAPARGILLFGPPGNGKTMLAKAVATESKQVFFNISASHLTSKWMGESEKLVRALFACAREMQPSIIFIDEIDSILSARKDSEHEAVRRMKTEFLAQFEGVGTNSEERVLVIGATNRPHEIDLAALRRFTKRIMVPLPDEEARMAMIRRLLVAHPTALSDDDYEEIVRLTEGYSGSDLAALAKDASMGPIREIDRARVPFFQSSEIRLIALNDFRNATRRIRPSVPASSLEEMKAWSLKYADCS